MTAKSFFYPTCYNLHKKTVWRAWDRGQQQKRNFIASWIDDRQFDSPLVACSEYWIFVTIAYIVGETRNIKLINSLRMTKREMKCRSTEHEVMKIRFCCFPFTGVWYADPVISQQFLVIVPALPLLPSKLLCLVLLCWVSLCQLLSSECHFSLRHYAGCC
jgi:hypothetical protein